MEKKNLMNTEEENKLIARFMGGNLEDNGWNFCLSDFGTNVIGGYGFYESFDLKFHKSWDWLMAVVDKIENLQGSAFTTTPKFKIEAGFIRIKANIGYIDNTLDTSYTYSDYVGFGGLVRANNNFDVKTKLEATYKAVVEFITWYNKNNEIIL